MKKLLFLALPVLILAGCSSQKISYTPEEKDSFCLETVNTLEKGEKALAVPVWEGARIKNCMVITNQSSDWAF